MTRVSIEEYPVTGDGGPYAITTGPDDALWYTLVRNGQIGRSVPGGEPSHHRLDPGCGPTIIASGPDSALWFTEWSGNRVGSITTDGVIETHDLPTPGAEHGITLGPDRAVWTALETGALARITT